MRSRIDWAEAIRPLLKKYKDKKHPLDAHNVYQQVVMVILSAQSSDDAINILAPSLFKAYPDMASMARANFDDLFPFIKGVRNFAHKAKWITEIARTVKSDRGIPLTMDSLTELPGIGRKSASVILRAAGKPAEGIIVDIHVLRVAPRLGIAEGDDPKKIEVQLMEKLPKEEWDAGMAMSFLGREICRPEPLCEQCLMNDVCAFYKAVLAGKIIRGKGKHAAGIVVATKKGAARGTKEPLAGKTKGRVMKKVKDDTKKATPPSKAMPPSKAKQASKAKPEKNAGTTRGTKKTLAKKKKAAVTKAGKAVKKAMPVKAHKIYGPKGASIGAKKG